MVPTESKNWTGINQPAEWAPHDACWLAWPSAGDLWLEDLRPAQGEFTALCQAIAAGGERLEILVPDTTAKRDATKALAGLDVRFHEIRFGDIWLRDTAPIFVHGRDGKVRGARFRFNGWGEKYVLPHDAGVSGAVAEASQLPSQAFDWILEGGSLDTDGEGTCLTTKQCLLNENRNPGLSQADLERRLAESLGFKKILWLGDGLRNDHTDGHVDTIARFVAPGRVLCMSPSGKDDPNAEILERIAADLRKMTDAAGRALDVVTVPSPGFLPDEDGNPMPASFVNFYVGNGVVVVPTYGTPYDAAAVAGIGKLFPDRKTTGLPAKAILTGGGAFHCITQQQPKELR